MKYFPSILIGITISMSCFSQVQKTPDKYVKGKKEGLWTEIDWYRKMDSTGKFYLVYQHSPLSVISEGVYEKGERVGFWKEFVPDFSEDNGKSYVRKGALVSITEYANANSCSLYVGYYENGNMRALGQYEEIPVDTTFTVQIPDWTTNADKLKDTVIHQTSRSRPVGKWYYFRPDGSVKELDMAKRP